MATSSSVERRNVTHLGDLELRLDVELDRLEMTMQEAGKLDCGDVLVVSRLHEGHYNVLVDGVLFGQGLLSVPKSNRKTLRLTQLADPSVPSEASP